MTSLFGDRWWVLLAVVAMSWAGTWVVRRYALRSNLLDIPNARSSHSLPTPRGGGVAIVLSLAAAAAFLATPGAHPQPLTWALLGSGGMVALLGFVDDHGHVPAGWRLLCHFAAAAWALFWLGEAPQIVFLGWSLDMGWLGHGVALAYLVWLLNLYNFMDGIDGIASIEAITVCLGGGFICWLAGYPGLGAAPVLLAAAVSGFFVWNFPNARIFMGDVGSGFLGMVLGVLSIDASRSAPTLWWSWLILLGVFIVDATWTLVRRLLRGDKVYAAHRSHAYQHAARMLGRHAPVTIAVGAINLFWLLPIALLVGVGRVDGVVGLLVAYLPLLWLARRLRAGLPEGHGDSP